MIQYWYENEYLMYVYRMYWIQYWNSLYVPAVNVRGAANISGQQFLCGCLHLFALGFALTVVLTKM